MKTEKPIEQFADRIKQTLTATSVPTYDWMYELGLSTTELAVYAYIFNVCKREPQAEHLINTHTIAELFNFTTANVSLVTNRLVKRGLISKRLVGRTKVYYSLYQPTEE